MINFEGDETPYIFHKEDDYVIFAQDGKGEFGGLRTLIFESNGHRELVGSYVTKEKYGYSEWCQIDKDYIMIFSRTSYNHSPMLKTIFDINANKLVQDKPKVLVKK